METVEVKYYHQVLCELQRDGKVFFGVYEHDLWEGLQVCVDYIKNLNEPPTLFTISVKFKVKTGAGYVDIAKQSYFFDKDNDIHGGEYETV